MAVLLRFEVQDQLHQPVRSFEEPNDEPFIGFCRVAKGLGVRYVDSIGPYQDSMLNSQQLQAWVEDFPGAIQSELLSERQRASAQRVLQAAREAEELAGYLFIYG